MNLNDVPVGTMVRGILITKLEGDQLAAQVLTPGIDADREVINHALLQAVLQEMGLPKEISGFMAKAMTSLLQDQDVLHNARKVASDIDALDLDSLMKQRPVANAQPFGPPFTVSRPTPPDWVQEILRAEEDFPPRKAEDK